MEQVDEQNKRDRRPFKVIVVGGGVGGLTLANMFDRYGIDYELLEGYGTLTPAVGASIGLLPNGLLILDQLGCYEAVRAASAGGEIVTVCARDEQGRLLGQRNCMDEHLAHCNGYPMLFFDRQMLLGVLASTVLHPERLHVNKHVVAVDMDDAGAHVTTRDGETFVGDVVIGADGIHSTVRRELRRLAQDGDPGYFPPGEEDRVPCYYQCSFGTAHNVDGWNEHEELFRVGRGHSFLVVSGPEQRCYWFLFVKLPAIRYGDDIPRYSADDESAFASRHAHLKITESLTFGQIYEKKSFSTLTPLHETVMKKWFYQRTFLLGDSIHKPNPIGGMGGNGAMETAAALLNELIDVRNSRPDGLDGLSTAEVQAIFGRVQAVRYDRSVATIAQAHQVQALIAYENPLLSTLVWEVLTPVSDYESTRSIAESCPDSVHLKHLPVPTPYHMIPFTFELPAVLVHAPVQKVVTGAYTAGMALLLAASTIVPATPPVSRSLYAFSQTMAPLLVYAVEGGRLGNRGSLLTLPLVFSAGLQSLGLSRVVPVWNACCALKQQIDPSDRFVLPTVARSLTPALAIGFVVPALLSATGLSGSTIDRALATAPLATSVLQTLLRTTFSISPIDKPHMLRYSRSDLPDLKTAYGFAFYAQAAAHVVSLLRVAAGFLAATDTSPAVIVASLPPDFLLGTASYVANNIYTVWSLRARGYITTATAVKAVLGVLAGQVLVGPGATWTALWAWREEVIDDPRK